ncbi:MAG: zinc ribbon domain-containing protein [Euryarchaeota archaeon]|nr:zinc ribbon domain-containing protein [Euryarchaeota archaeon]
MYTVFVVAALLASSILLIGSGNDSNAVAQTAPALQITALDYTTLPTEMFGDGAAVHVKLIDSAKDTTDLPDKVTGVSVKSVTSGGAALDPQGASGTPWTIDLIETGYHTGVFVGSFIVATAPGCTTPGASPAPLCPPVKTHPHYGKIFGDGILKVAANAKITVSKDSLTDDVSWRVADDSTATAAVVAPVPAPAGFPPVIPGYGIQIGFRVFDADLHATTSLDVYPAAGVPSLLRVFSDSDPTGEVVTLVESKDQSATVTTPVPTPGASKADGGYFFGTIGFEASAVPANGKVFVQHGDRVQAVLTDLRGTNGLARTLELPRDLVASFNSWTFQTSSEGSVGFAGDPYFGADAVPAGGDGFFETQPVLFVFDVDESVQNAGRDTVVVKVTTTSDSVGSCVELTELGGGSGLFFGNLVVVTTDQAQVPTSAANARHPPPSTPFGGGCPNQGPWVRAANGDRLNAQYTDLTDFGGVTQTRTALSRFFTVQTACVQLGPDGCAASTGPTGRLVGATGSHNVIVVDPDANLDPLVQEQVTVKVKSTSDPSSLSVTLTEIPENSGRFIGNFQFGDSTGAGRLRVTDRDQVVVEYDDARRADGTRGIVRSNLVTWRDATDGQVFLDAPYYVKQATGTSYGTAANVMILDADQNDPYLRDVVSVSMVDLDSGQGVTYANVLETGIDTGMFHVEVPFGTGTVGGVPRFDPGTLVTDNNDDLRAEYSDPVADDGTPKTFASPNAKWLVGSALSRLETATGERLTSIYIGTAAPQSLDLTVKVAVYSSTPVTSIGVHSSRCSTDVPVTLSPSGDRFVGDLILTTDPGTAGDQAARCTALRQGSPAKLGVNVGDGQVVQITGDTANIAVSRARATTGYDFLDASGGPLLRAFGRVAPVGLRIVGSAQNEDSSARDVGVLQIFPRGAILSPADADVINVVAVETGSDTNTFLTSFGFGAVSSGAAQVVRANIPTTAQVPRDVQNGRQLPGANIRAKLMNDPAVEGVYWYPATDPSFSPTAAGSLSGKPRVRIVDDESTGYVFGETLQGSGVAAYTLASSSVEASHVIVSVTRAETTPSPSEHTVGAVAEGSLRPILDRNRDGVLSCADVTLSPSTATCSSTEADLVAGVVKYSTPSCTPSLTQQCASFEVQYEYQAIPSTSLASPNNDGFHYRQTLANQITFGEAIPTGRTISVDYRVTSMMVAVGSENGGEQEQIPFVLIRTNTAQANDPMQYEAQITVEALAVASNQAVKVTGGATTHQDRLVVSYADPHMVDGLPGVSSSSHFRNRVATVDWLETETGTLSFRKSDFSGAAPSPFFGPFVPVEVRDLDFDSTGDPDSFLITARNAANAQDTVAVAVRETGTRTGLFRGLVPVVPGTPVSGDGSINIAGGSGAIVVSYTDPQSVTGTTVTPAISIGWRPSATGFVVVSGSPAVPSTNPGPPVPPVTLKGSSDALYIRVTDGDRNLDDNFIDQLTVNVFSFADPAGETITLLEDGPRTNSFVSAGVRFETSLVAGNGKVFAPDFAGGGETIRVRYVDPLNQVGLRVTEEPPATISWDRTFDTQIAFNREFYIGFDPTISPDPNGVHANTLMQDVTVLVADGDLNQLAGTVERHSTRLKLGRLDASGEFVAGTDKTFEIVEVGANTGVFFGRATFKNSAASDPEDAPITSTAKTGRVGMTPDLTNARLRARVVDDFGAAGDSLVFVRDADWFRPGFGVIKLDRAGYNVITQQPEISVWDAHRDTDPTGTGTADTLSVTVKSNENPTGISLTLTETAVHSGLFKGKVTLSQAATPAAGAIKVRNNDVLQAVYADQNPTGSRTASATIAIGDTTPPVTSLVTSPAVADGLRGVFKTKPLVSFTASEPIQKTFYRIGTGATQEFPQGGTAFELGEGSHLVKFWSIDSVGNTEADPNRTVEVDLTNPTQALSGLRGAADAGGKVTLNWTAPAATTNPFDFFEYVVFRDGGATPLGAVSQPNFTDSTVNDEQAHTYQVAIRDKSGRQGPLSTSVSVTPDKTVPVLSGASVSPAKFDTRAKPTGLAVAVTATDTNLKEVTAALVPPSGTAIVTATLTRGASGPHAGTLAVSAVDQPCACQVVFTATDQAGNVATANASLTVTGPDTEPPKVSFPNLGSNAEVALGTPVDVTVTDNVALATVTYTVDGGTPQTATITTPTSVSFSVPTGTLGLGPHTVVVTAVDQAVDASGNPAPNQAVGTANFVLKEAAQIGKSGFLPTNATALSNGDVKVTWTLPEDVPAGGVGGFQVWRAASPFALVGTVEDPSRREFIDESAVAGRVYRYVVSWYGASPLESLQQVVGFTSEEDVPASAPVTAEKTGIPAWVWVVSAIAGIIAIAIIVGATVAMRSRNRGGATQQVVMTPPPEAEASGQEAAQGELHRLKCPQCQHRFEVVGTKPIVTVCPNCGKKGILR